MTKPSIFTWTGEKHFFYTLYSLEKVGDLGQIERFGGHEWYREGAAKLLDLERKEGGWETTSIHPLPSFSSPERRSASR